jgi:hypothetical protein
VPFGQVRRGLLGSYCGRKSFGCTCKIPEHAVGSDAILPSPTITSRASAAVSAISATWRQRPPVSGVVAAHICSDPFGARTRLAEIAAGKYQPVVPSARRRYLLWAPPETPIEIQRRKICLRVAGKDFIAFYLRKPSEPFRNRQLIVGAHINSIRGSPSAACVLHRRSGSHFWGCRLGRRLLSSWHF